MKEGAAVPGLPGGPSPPPHSNPIIAHWRGEYPLWISEWVIVGGGLVLIQLIWFNLPFPPVTSRNAVVGLLALREVLPIPVYAWLLVGVWRAGGAHARQRAAAGENPAWGRKAQVGAILIALWLTWDLLVRFPFVFALP